MIPEIYLDTWRKNAPWQSSEMIEQDLIISRALVELYEQPVIAKNLAFRGGTALNKLFITPPARYSEDIDLVQINAESIGDTITAIRKALDHWLGEPKRKLTERSVKLVYRYATLTGASGRLKVEINTTEHFHIEPLQTIDFPLESRWFEGQTTILTYQLNELMATKLHALYQRRKGRDLFDLWFVLDKQLIEPNKIPSIFEQYCGLCQENITRAMFEQSMFEKRKNIDFREEIVNLLNPNLIWEFERAEKKVHQELISQLKGDAWKTL